MNPTHGSSKPWRPDQLQWKTLTSNEGFLEEDRKNPWLFKLLLRKPV